MKPPRRRKKKTDPMMRIQVQLPPSYKAALDALRREGYSASAYMRHLLERDLDARQERGWTLAKGWSGRELKLQKWARKELAKMEARRGPFVRKWDRRS